MKNLIIIIFRPVLEKLLKKLIIWLWFSKTSDINIDVRYWKIENADLDLFIFNGSTFEFSEFKKAKFANTIFSESILEDCIFRDVIFKNIDFSNAKFENCKFKI